MNEYPAYGSWPSPITAEHVAAAGRRFADLTIDDADGAGSALYWVESRPEEAGRNTVMRARAGGAPESLLGAPAGARSAVYEYGGGAIAAHAGILWFVDSAEQAVWQRATDGALSRVTCAHEPARFGDLQYDPAGHRVIAVVETPREAAEPEATIEAINVADGTRTVIARGHDFYASPRLAPDGRRLAWLAWNHPHMPWDATELWQADIGASGLIGAPFARWAPDHASLFCPRFDPAGRLHIVCDADDWWNIYRENGPRERFVQLTHETAEFGVPQWVFGQSTYDFAADGTLYAIATRDGVWQVGRVDLASGAFVPLDTALDFFEYCRVWGNTPVLIAASAQKPKHIAVIEPGGGFRALRETAGLPADAPLSMPEPVSWDTANGDIAHGLFYPPAGAGGDAGPPAGSRPPLILKCHGGPTGATSTAQDARIQYWTSRGYGLLDVNYRGSTGYGRAYRDKLAGAWGIADVADCVSGAQALAERGRIDAERVVISGSSAGGYTVLCVLTFSDAAAAGASYYGIGDLTRLLASTHKFESRYLLRLIGDDKHALAQRSPLNHAERLSCPVLFLQGLQDKVVPPDQAQAMVDVLRGRGVAVAHVTFAEERHGFRDAANIKRAIEAERSFYTRVLRIPGADDLEPLAIDNFV